MLLVFSRDTSILEIFDHTSASPPKCFIRGSAFLYFLLLFRFLYSLLFQNRQVLFYYYVTGKLGNDEYSVIYPPNGVIPFHGFSMYVTPLCYQYAEPTRLYYMFREFYMRFFHRLHSISSHPQVSSYFITMLILLSNIITLTI